MGGVHNQDFIRFSISEFSRKLFQKQHTKHSKEYIHDLIHE